LDHDWPDVLLRHWAGHCFLVGNREVNGCDLAWALVWVYFSLAVMVYAFSFFDE
jgi:hypothetical protein